MGAGVNISLSYARMALTDAIMDRAMSSLLDKILKGTKASAIMPGGNLGLNAFIQAVGTQCSMTRRGCLIGKIPLLSTGSDLKSHAYHIVASQHGYGNTRSGYGVTSAVLIRGVSGLDRKWLAKKVPGCQQKTKACDEYPFLSTWNGGPVNWDNDTVSTATLPLNDSRRQMHVMNNFYKGAKIGIGMPFLSIGNGFIRSYYIKDKNVSFLK